MLTLVPGFWYFKITFNLLISNQFKQSKPNIKRPYSLIRACHSFSHSFFIYFCLFYLALSLYSSPPSCFVCLAASCTPYTFSHSILCFFLLSNFCAHFSYTCSFPPYISSSLSSILICQAFHTKIQTTQMDLNHQIKKLSGEGI